MYNKHLIVMYSVFGVSLLISYLLKVDYTDALTNSMMTVLSIIFGFNITAISTLYSKKFVVNLHKKIDKEQPGQTQLHTLKNYFAISCKMALTTIMYLVLYQLLITKCKYILLNFIDIELLLTSLILPLISMNIILLLFLLKVFLKGLIFEAEDM